MAACERRHAGPERQGHGGLEPRQIASHQRLCILVVQLFEAVETVATPQSPGSRSTPMPAHGQHNHTRSNELAARETAEASASASASGAALSQLATCVSMAPHDEADEAVAAHPDVAPSDSPVAAAGDEVSPAAGRDCFQLSDSMRQMSVASCASEWHDPRMGPGVSHNSSLLRNPDRIDEAPADEAGLALASSGGAGASDGGSP